MLEDCNSIEEFICKNNRYPSIDEYKLIINLLWDKYIKSLNTEEQLIAMENDELGKEFKQDQVIKRIPVSTEKLKKLLNKNKDVLSVRYFERWGMFKICVVVNCLRRKNLYKFRKDVCNFFEGWEVTLVPAKLFEKIFFCFKKTGKKSVGKGDN